MELNRVKLANGEEIAYRRRVGGDQKIILVHGNLASSAFYDEVLRDLPKDFDAYAIDMRGFGDSTYHRPIEGLRDLAGDIKLFADALGLKSFDLLGWSTGGAVSMHFCSSYGHMVNRLILVASAGVSGYHSYADEPGGVKRLITTRRELMNEPTKVALEQALKTNNRDYYKKVWTLAIYNKGVPNETIFEKHITESLKQRNLMEIYHGLNSFNISDYYNGVTVGTNEALRIKNPVTILQGDSDLLVSVLEARELKAAIGEHAELIVLESCGHSPMVDAHDELVKAIIG